MKQLSQKAVGIFCFFCHYFLSASEGLMFSVCGLATLRAFDIVNEGLILMILMMTNFISNALGGVVVS